MSFQIMLEQGKTHFYLFFVFAVIVCFVCLAFVLFWFTFFFSPKHINEYVIVFSRLYFIAISNFYSTKTESNTLHLLLQLIQWTFIKCIYYMPICLPLK